MIKNWILYSLALIGAFIFFVNYIGWYAWVLFLFILFVPLVSLGTMFYAVRHVEVRLFCADRVERGDDVSMNFDVRYSGKVPCAPVRIYFSMDEPKAKKNKTQVSVFPGTARQVDIQTLHCGKLVCRIKKYRIYDSLGLFYIQRRHETIKSIIVMPHIGHPEPEPTPQRISSGSVMRPKPGSYSEIYELREYRPGDPIRSVHWKLSSKIDNLLVKEPQSPDSGMAVLTVDILPTGDRYDAVLDRLISVSLWMIERDYAHEIKWIDPRTGKMTGARINSNNDVTPAIASLISTPYAEGMPSVCDTPFTSWHYHINSGEGEE
ncbi:MAG: DUF58 domain-containing protein [Clostridia bacterium]|nr:DUF58 domain-containing protein [Clostridia bacterium]